MACTVGGLEDLADAIEADGGLILTLVPSRLPTRADCSGFASRDPRALGPDRSRGPCRRACPTALARPISPTRISTGGSRSICAAPPGWIALVQPLLLAATGCFVYVADDRAGEPFFRCLWVGKTGAEALVRSWAAESARIRPQVALFHPAPMPTDAAAPASSRARIALPRRLRRRGRTAGRHPARLIAARSRRGPIAP